MSKRTVTNTEDPTRNSTAEHILGIAQPGAIEAMEAAGQKEFVESDVFPTEIAGKGSIQQLESLGFIFHEVVPNDPLFRYVTLPEGWSRVATDHDMWSIIRDEKGAERVGIFYKAAYYDRRAHAHVVKEEESNA